MTVEAARWRWGGIFLANGLLWLAACVAPVSSSRAVAVDRAGHDSSRQGAIGDEAPVPLKVPIVVKNGDPQPVPADEESHDAGDEMPGPAAEGDANAEGDAEDQLGNGLQLEMPPPPPLAMPFLMGADLANDGDGEQNLPLDVRLFQAARDLTLEIAADPPSWLIADTGVQQEELQQLQVVEPQVEIVQQKVEAAEKPVKAAKPAGKEVPKWPGNPIRELLKEVMPRRVPRRPTAKPAAPPAAPAVGPARGQPPGVRTQAVIEAEQKERGRKESARRRQAGDPSVAYDPKKSEWMARARERIDAKDWHQAFDYLQRIVEHPEDALYRRPSGVWSSIRQEAQRLQGEAPDEELANYRAQYAGLAQQFLTRAIQSNDVELLGRVARLYFHTPAGYEATDRLANVHLDRGEYGLAGRLFQSLWEVQAPPTQSRVWKFKALLAYRIAGQTSWAEQLTPELTSAPAAIDIGGRPVDSRKWLEERTRPVVSPAQVLAEWTMPFGNKSRTAKAAGGRPLLLSRWSLPTAQLAGLRTNLNLLAEDLSDQGNVALPGFFPIMVGDKIAFRTYRGVQVADVATGRPLWRSETDQPLEELLSVRPDQVNNQENFRFRKRFFAGGGMMAYQPSGGDSQPLCNLACRNSNFGLISSDGSRLFVLEDPQTAMNRQPTYSFWDDGQQASRSESNVLTAYDLSTGHRAWEVGGDDFGEAFQLPLAGNFFFGPPLYDGQDLLLVGEQARNNNQAKNSEIRLYALDPATGRPKWSQLIGIAEVGIGRDVLRRAWSAQTAAGEGVIVCPTTSHWLVGIDRATRSLLWGYQVPRLRNTSYQADGTNQEFQAMVQQMPLAGRWFPSPPVIARQRVVYAPLESNQLICLDLFTGKELWQIPRGDFLSVGGVYDDVVLLISRNALAAYALQNGQPLWRVTTPGIVGRGIAVDKNYYVPCAGGELWSISLETGLVGEKSYLAGTSGTEGKLGNLAFHRGMLMSLSLSDLTAFEQNDALRSQIADRQRQNPKDAWANLREAGIRLLQREYGPALAALRKISEKDLPSDLVSPYREAMIEALTRSIRSDFNREVAEDLAALGELSRTPEQRLEFQKLLAERSIARKEFVAAFDTFLSLTKVAKADGPDERIFSTGSVRVRVSTWLSGQIAELWRNLPKEQRVELDARVEKLAKAQAGQPAASQSAFVELFRSHPAAVSVTRELIERYAGSRDFVATERLLLRWQRGDDRALAAVATERLARLMLEFQLPGDAAEFYHELESRFGDVKLEDGKAGTELVRGLRTAGLFPVAPSAPDWSHRKVRVDRLGAQYTEQLRQDLSRIGSRRPFFRQNLLQVQTVDQRLEIVRLDNGEMYWSLPLRSRLPNGQQDRSPVASESSEHQLTILHQGVLHGLSPVERKVLWTRPIEGRGQNPYSYSNIQNPLIPMRNLGDVSRRRQRVQQTGSGGGGSLAFANTEIVGYLGRRSLTVLDAVTGELLWTWDRVRTGTKFLAAPDVVYFVSPDSSQLQALRASDGQPVTLFKSAEASWNSLIELVGGHDLVLPVHEGSNITRVKRFDPLRDREIWNVKLPRGSLFSSLDNDWLTILQPDGKLSTLDLVTGRMTEIAKLPTGEMQNRMEMYCFVDYENLYVIVNNAPNYNNNYQEGIPWVKSSGVVYAFDLESQKQRWKKSVPGQNLMLDRFDALPGLLFATRRYEQKGRIPYWSFNMLLVDKRTGQSLIEESAATQNGFQSLWFHPKEQTIELRSYNERVRISAVAVGNAPANPVPAVAPHQAPGGAPAGGNPPVPSAPAAGTGPLKPGAGPPLPVQVGRPGIVPVRRD